MASGLKMMYLGIVWVSVFMVLMLFTFAGNIVFSLLATLQNLGIPSSVIPWSTVQGIFPLFYILILIVEILVTYRLYEEAVSDVNSYPGL